MTRHLAIALLAALCCSPAVLAQSTISSAHKMCWSENCGFVNWRDAGTPGGSQGVRIHATFLSGFAWGENVGWINFGDGTPTNGTSYANPQGGTVVGVPDFGVNRDPGSGELTGFAWGENIGWINFRGGAGATPESPARYDAAAHRFRGFVWGENIGWINLDDTTVFVGDCPADFNADGALSVQDIFDFLSAWFAGDRRADFNGGGLAVQDIFDYLTAWFGGC